MNESSRDWCPAPRTVALVLGAFLALGGLAASASAQDEGGGDEPPANQPAKRENPDISFAVALGYDYQWYDLAFEVLDQLEKTARGPDLQGDTKLLRVKLKTKWATSLKDAKQRAEELAAVEATLKELASKPGSRAAEEAAILIGDLSLQKGDGAFQRMRTSEDGDSRAAARKEAEDAYGDAEKFFNDQRAGFEKMLDSAQTAGNNTKIREAVAKLVQVRFNGARAVYQHAMLFEKGAKERDDRLAKAAQLFEEINTEFADQFLGYEAAIFLGLSSKELNDPKKAYAAFDSALGIKGFYDQNEQGRYKFDAEAQDIVARASYFKAQTMNEIRDYDMALKSVKDLFDLIPDMQRIPLGYAARVEEGKAWAGKGDAKKAVAILDKIIEEDKGGPWAASAKEQIAVINGGGGAGVTIAPDKALQSAETAIDRGREAEGLNQIRNLIATLEQSTAEDQAKWLPTCWLKLGLAYSGKRRYDEATACFDACYARFRSGDEASKAVVAAALFEAAKARGQVNGAKSNDFDKSAYLDTLKILQREYSDKPEAKASSFLLGSERFGARDYAKAATEFEKTTESAQKLYDQALYLAGLSHFMEASRLATEKKADEAKAEFAQARLSLEKAVAWAAGNAKGAVTEGERANTLRKIAFDSRCSLAKIALHPLVKEPAKALAAADAAEKGYGGNPDPDRVAEARLLKVQAHLAADAVDKAEEVVASMGTDAGESPKTAQAEREVAIAVDKQAEGKKDKKDEAKALYTKAADHYTRWFEISEKAKLDLSAKDLARAADRLYSLSMIVNGLPDGTESFVQVDDLSKLEAAGRFSNAAAIYEAAIRSAGSGPAVSSLYMKLGECYGFARDFEKARKALLETCVREKLLKEEVEADESGKKVKVVNIDVNVATKNLILLFAYADYARAGYEVMLAERNPDRLKERADEVISAYFRVLNVAPSGQEIWWRAKYYLFAALYEKGEYADAAIGMKQLKRQNQSYDGDKYKLKDKFEALSAKLDKVDTSKASGSGKAGGNKPSK